MLRICNVKRARERALEFDKCSYLDEISVRDAHKLQAGGDFGFRRDL